MNIKKSHPLDELYDKTYEIKCGVVLKRDYWLLDIIVYSLKIPLLNNKMDFNGVLVVLVNYPTDLG